LVGLEARLGDRLGLVPAREEANREREEDAPMPSVAELIEKSDLVKETDRVLSKQEFMLIGDREIKGLMNAKKNKKTKKHL
jgi:hypothetical protein